VWQLLSRWYPSHEPVHKYVNGVTGAVLANIAVNVH
jgi:hypothetical protein